MSAALAPGVRTDDVLTVRAAGEWLALPAALVLEVIRTPTLTWVPHAPPGLLGVANLRRDILPVVSLAALLGHAADPRGSGARVVVLSGAAPVGVLVESVGSLTRDPDVRRIDPGALLAHAFGPMVHRTAAGGPTVTSGPDAAPTDGAAQAELSLIGLRIAGQEFALPLDKVAEVLRPPAAIAAIPRTDDAMIGVIAHRDGTLPVVSLRHLLGLPPHAGDHTAARIVVTRLGGSTAGLLVDAVTATLRVPAAAIDPVSPVLMRGVGEAQAEGICRIEGGRRLVTLLSPARLLDPATMTMIQSYAGQETPAVASPSTADAGTLEQFVLFRLGDEQYGLPIASVAEVVRHPGLLTRLPQAPDFVDGVMELRGRVMPIIDQRRRFGLPDGDQPGRRILVMTLGGLEAGFVVDSVSAVLSVPTTDLRPAPAFTAEGEALFDRVAIERDGRLVLLVSPAALLDQTERDLLAALDGAPAGA